MMTVDLLHLAAPVVALAAMSAVHAIWCRLVPSVPLLNALAGAGVAGLVVLALVEVGAVLAGQCSPQVMLRAVLVDAPVFGCLAYGYANFVNLGQSSVRVRIYRELLAAPDGVPIGALKREYDEQAMLDARLERLVSAGDLRLDGGTYRIGKPRLLHIATVIFGLKRFVLGSHSEFSS